MKPRRGRGRRAPDKRQGVLSAAAFGKSFQRFLEAATAGATDAGGPPIRRRLQAHFGVDPAGLPVLGESFSPSDHPNVQLAVDAFLAGDGRSAEVTGIAGIFEYEGVTLAQLTAPRAFQGEPVLGPVQYVNLPVDSDRVLPCIQRGLYFVRDGAAPLVLLVQGPRPGSYLHDVRIEAMASERAGAERALAELRRHMRARNVYRGHVVSLEVDESRQIRAVFHRLPTIDRDAIILPAGLLDRIERQTVGFSAQRERLLAAGRHLKRGLLFYGPPGTGKTMTAMYLAGCMRERTVLVLTGRGLGLVEQSCAMARTLEPSIVILEDVDLVAQERSSWEPGCNAVLFELLNQMDGLADDADVVFLLTTNRPEILEPALASRPGRVDQAFLFPLPDRDGRCRLFDLYGRGLTRRSTDPEKLVSRTENASPALIRELLRRAALLAADEGRDPLVVEDAHLDRALEELLVDGGALTRTLLGARDARVPAS